MKSLEVLVVLSVEGEDALDLALEISVNEDISVKLPESDGMFEPREHRLYSLDQTTLVDIAVKLIPVPASIIALATAVVNYRLAKKNKVEGKRKESITIGEESQPINVFVDPRALATYIDAKVAEELEKKLANSIKDIEHYS